MNNIILINLWVLLQVILIDLVLSGDNAVIIGAIVAKLEGHQQKVALLSGIGLAIVLRLLMAVTAVYLLAIPGLNIVGGIMLSWVAFKMLRDILDDGEENASTVAAKSSLISAMIAIAVADVSMSLDNVIGVAGAVDGHPIMLVAGIIFSMILMGFGASIVARIINRYTWINWLGLALIVFVALRMFHDGWMDPIFQSFIKTHFSH